MKGMEGRVMKMRMEDEKQRKKEINSMGEEVRT